MQAAAPAADDGPGGGPEEKQWANVRALTVTLLLFLAITTSQFIGSAIAGSLSLLIDSASMLVDVLTYAANLWAECGCSGPRSRADSEKTELLVSGVSLGALWAITLPSAFEAIATLANLDGARDADDAVNGHIVLGFALAGLAVDGASLAEFARSWRSGAAFAPDETGAHGLNMTSALVHVLADLFRSSTTLVESVVLLRFTTQPAATDAICALFVAGAIVATSAPTTVRWFRAVMDRVRSGGEVASGEAIAGEKGGAAARAGEPVKPDGAPTHGEETVRSPTSRGHTLHRLCCASTSLPPDAFPSATAHGGETEMVSATGTAPTRAASSNSALL